MTGPSWTEQWTSWKSRTANEMTTLAVKSELERLLGHEKARKPQLSADEMTTIKRNLQTQKIAATDEQVGASSRQVPKLGMDVTVSWVQVLAGRVPLVRGASFTDAAIPNLYACVRTT